MRNRETVEMVDICKVLEYLIKEFEKINGKNFKIYYVKVALPAETSETDRGKRYGLSCGEMMKTNGTRSTHNTICLRERKIQNLPISFMVLL